MLAASAQMLFALALPFYASMRRGCRVCGAFIYQSHRLQHAVVHLSAFIFGLLVGGAVFPAALVLVAGPLAETAALSFLFP